MTDRASQDEEPRSNIRENMFTCSERRAEVHHISCNLRFVVRTTLFCSCHLSGLHIIFTFAATCYVAMLRRNGGITRHDLQNTNAGIENTSKIHAQKLAYLYLVSLFGLVPMVGEDLTKNLTFRKH